MRAYCGETDEIRFLLLSDIAFVHFVFHSFKNRFSPSISFSFGCFDTAFPERPEERDSHCTLQEPAFTRPLCFLCCKAARALSTSRDEEVEFRPAWKSGDREGKCGREFFLGRIQGVGCPQMGAEKAGGGCGTGSAEMINRTVRELIHFRQAKLASKRASNQLFCLSRSSGSCKHHTTTSPYLLESSCQWVLKPLQHSVYCVPVR